MPKLKSSNKSLRSSFDVLCLAKWRYSFLGAPLACPPCYVGGQYLRRRTIGVRVCMQGNVRPLSEGPGCDANCHLAVVLKWVD